ncbi:MAG TPA: response regulator [Gammaproteobacteria bacterium]|nr:response regulator [Gammaproteobacteria bacterium]
MSSGENNVGGVYGSLRHSLLLWLLLISLLPLGFVSWFSYQQASASLMDSAESRLVQASGLSISYFKSWFKYRLVDLRVQSEAEKNIEFLESLEEGFRKSGEPLANYINSSDWVQRINEKQNDLVSFSGRYDYISDVFIIDIKGNILFSVMNKADLGDNVFSGKISNTLFSRSVRKTIKSGGVVFSDLERYAPSNYEVVGFLTAPLVNKNTGKQGVLAIQIRIDKILQVLKGGEISGHHEMFYLVGEDARLRTSIKNNKEEILNRVIDTQQIKIWREHNHSMAENAHSRATKYIGPDGNEVIGIHHELDLPGVKWALVSEISSREALNSADLLMKVTLVLFLITAVVVLMLVIYISGRITLPIVKLADASMKIAAGERGLQVDVSAKNEIGRLAEAFNYMIEKLEVSEEKNKEYMRQTDESLNALKEQKFALDQHSIVAITDVQGMILFVNDKFSEISGYSKLELIGHNHRMLKSGHHNAAFFKEMYRTIASGNVWHDEICNKAKDGRVYWVDTTIVPLIGDNGKPKKYIAIRTDVTVRKKIEAELTEAKDIAEEAVMAKGQFLASMSHEIRTPMNGVLGMLSLLQNTELNDEQHHRLSVAQSSAKSLLGLINDILDYSKVDAGKLELEILDFNLRDMLGDISDVMGYQAQSKDIELILDVKGVEHTMVRGDPGRVRQVITNLVSNAIKFTTEGEVTISVELHEKTDDRLLLSCCVSDTGIGIPECKVDDLFSLFSQVDASTTRKYGGTGLGLSIARKLCQLMGGGISVTSKEGFGSCFKFTLMLGKSNHSQLAVPEVKIDKLSILIVDDNQTNLEVLCGQLESWGAQVVQAKSGAQAIKICEQRIEKGQPVFDIAFLDMRMPEMDGVELSKELKADKKYSAMKLVMMTSMGHQGDTRFFADLGFSAYFPKPVTTSDLFDALAVVTEDGDALHQAIPLLTSRYLKTLKHGKSVFNDEANELQQKIVWPDRCRILLVEDNHVNQLVASGILNEIGLQADVAANGLEAVRSLQEAPEDAPYTLVLMDCQMPEMDGYEASRAIRDARAGERNKGVVILAMTANAMDGDREKCMEAGMNDYLSKPVDVDKLLEKLIQWIPVMQDDVSHSSVKNQHAGDMSQKGRIQESRSDKNNVIWNKDDALKRILGNEVILKTLLEVYISESSDSMVQLKEAVKNKKLEEVRLIAHTMKGVAANLSAMRVQFQAGVIEHAAYESRFEEVESLMPELENHVSQLLECFGEYIEQESVDSKGEGVSVLDDKELSGKLKILIVRLKNSDYIDPDEIEPLRHAGKSAAVQQLLSVLCGQIAEFDNAAALETIKEIEKSGLPI